MIRTLVLFGGVAVVAMFVSLSGVTRPGGEAFAQASMAPDECVCSPGLALDKGGSLLRNCQCGAMQCVVVTGSGQLQCR